MNLLITGAWQQATVNLKAIKQCGYNVVFLQYEKDELPCEYQWVEGVIGNGLFLYHPIEKFTNLKYIQLTSAGFDRVPMDYVNAHNIEIHNARGVYSIPMAEFALAGVLQIYKQMDFFKRSQEIHEWNKHRGLLELFGKTVCIVGCGSVGTECAKRFTAFGCQVVGVDLYVREDKNYNKIVKLKRLDAVLPDADVVVLTLPLTKQTQHLMDEAKFRVMKQGAIIINIARGAIVDEQALVQALQANLRGAVLDVFEEEPLDANSNLWEMKNVIITPHNSFVSDGNSKRLVRLIIENLKLRSEE